MSTTLPLPEFTCLDNLVYSDGPQTSNGGIGHSWCLIMTPFSVNDFCELLDQKQIEYKSRAQAVRYLPSASLYLEYDHGRRFGLYNFWDLLQATIKAARGDLAVFEAKELDEALETIASFVEEAGQVFQPASRSHFRDFLLRDVRLEQELEAQTATDTAFVALHLEAYAQCVSIFRLLDAKLSNIPPELVYANGENCR